MDSAASQILAVALPIVGLVLTYVVRTGIAAFERRTAIHLTDQQRMLLVNAGERAGGIAYDFLASRSSGMDPETAREHAFEAGIAYVKTVAPAAIAALGIPETAVQDMVRGQLGKLLAVDPNISVQGKLNPPA